MSIRLQILLSDAMARRMRKAAQRRKVSMNAWLQGAIERALIDEHPVPDPLEQLSTLGGPTGDIEQMIAEIGAGRKRTDAAL